MHPTTQPAPHRRPVRQAHPIDATPRFRLPAVVGAAALVVALVLGGLAFDGGRMTGAAGREPREAAAAMSFDPIRSRPAGDDARAQPASAAPLADARELAATPASASTAEAAPPSESGLSGAAPSPSQAPSPEARTAAVVAEPAAVTPGGGPVVPVGTRRNPVRATFLGDSYTTGWNGYGRGSRGWPAIVARSLGWKVINLAVAGTGFVNPGWTAQPLRTRIARAVRSRPQVLVVATGHNDSRYGAAAASAARRDLARLRQKLPDAVIVVVAPIWANGSPPTSILRLRTALRREAKAIHAVFVDPLAGGWFAGANHRLISGDGIHPTDAGHRHIARLVLRSLRR